MTYYFASNLEPVEINYCDKIGRGTDGTVYKHKNLALKLLEFDNKTREENGRLDFEKARYFIEEVRTKRIWFPIDILLDTNGIYSGIVMNLIDKIPLQNINLLQYSMDDLFLFIEELIENYEKELTPKKIAAFDINLGSYCLTPNFLQMCDVDKYRILANVFLAQSENKNKMVYSLAKAIYYLNFISVKTTKEERKKWQKWIKMQVKEKQLLQTITSDNLQNHFDNVNEYITYTRKRILES